MITREIGYRSLTTSVFIRVYVVHKRAQSPRDESGAEQNGELPPPPQAQTRGDRKFLQCDRRPPRDITKGGRRGTPLVSSGGVLNT